jgi:hypothetical protein
MEGFSFVTPVIGLNRPNTGKEDDDDIYRHTHIHIPWIKLVRMTECEISHKNTKHRGRYKKLTRDWKGKASRLH